MSYDDAVRKYGIDKPDMRLPAMVELSDDLDPALRETLKIEQKLPILGFIIPKAGGLSGTERKKLLSEVRAGFGDSGLDLLDTERLKTNETFAPLAATITQKLEATPEDLVVVVTPKLGTPEMWNYDRQWIYKRVGAVAPAAGPEVRRQAQTFRADRHRQRLQIPLGYRLSHVRVGRRDQDLERRASSLHLTA